jgi:hypothetical protein
LHQYHGQRGAQISISDYNVRMVRAPAHMPERWCRSDGGGAVARTMGTEAGTFLPTETPQHLRT